MPTENMEDLDELMESDDLESDDEAVAEEEPEFLPFPPFVPPSALAGLFGGGRRSPRVARGQGYYQPRLWSQFVTQTQLRATAARIQRDVRTNATAIRAVNTRISGIEARQAKNNAHQAKQIAMVRNELKKARDMNLIMFLLTRPKTTDATTAAFTIGGVTLPPQSRLLFETGTGFNPLVLLFLFGGFGGDSGSGGDSTLNSLLPILILQPGLFG